MAGHPIRDRGTAAPGHASQLGEIGDRQDARHDRHADTSGGGTVTKAQVQIDVEKELGDRTAGAGVELGFQIIEVVPGAARRGMGFGISGDADLEIGDPLQPGDQIRRIGIAAGMRRIAVRAICRPAADRPVGRIAAQRDDMADAGFPIVAGNVVDLIAGGGDAGQMRGRFEPGFLADPPHRRVGALAGRTAGSVSNRDKARRQRLEPLDDRP